MNGSTGIPNNAYNNECINEYGSGGFKGYLASAACLATQVLAHPSAVSASGVPVLLPPTINPAQPGDGNSGRAVGEEITRPTTLRFGQHVLSSMAKRGWTPEDVWRAVETGERYTAEDLTEGGAPATRYVDPVTGRSVVVNNATGNVIHVGGFGFEY